MKIFILCFKQLTKLAVAFGVITITVLWFGLLLPVPTLTSGQSFQSLIINNVSIVDVKSGGLIANQNILIEGNRITSISESTLSPGSNTVIINGTDRFVMPGLWDMHGHFIHHSPQIHFPLLVAHGVTHVREMGFGSPVDAGSSDSILMSLSDRNQWRDRIENQELIGPYISSSAVYQIEEYGDIWGNDEEMPPLSKIVEVFSTLKQQGIDFIKITLENNPPKEFFYRIMQAANQMGLNVVGHKPRRISAIEASNLGLKSFEHARFLVIESSSLRDTYLNGSFKGMGKPETLYRTMIDSYDPQLAAETFQALISNDSWYCPTHITRRWEAHYDDDNYRADKRVEHVPYLLRSIWSLDAFLMSKKVPSGILKDFYQHGLTITKQAHQSGVKLLAGSDMLDPYAFYGSGLWDELSEFDKAGIPVKDTLQIATINSATFTNQQDSFGSVEVGKIADLLLLGDNPLEDISHLESLEMVIVHQQIFDQSDIAMMKSYVADIATSWAFTSQQWWVTVKSFF